MKLTVIVLLGLSLSIMMLLNLSVSKMSLSMQAVEEYSFKGKKMSDIGVQFNKGAVEIYLNNLIVKFKGEQNGTRSN
ncbi:MAG: hypothetical protein PHR06_05370 [Candidatus Cloacimonetes bacterium]|nr:hypothetical protein [Candidatus Cloacimonadota bacterium]